MSSQSSRFWFEQQRQCHCSSVSDFSSFRPSSSAPLVQVKAVDTNGKAIDQRPGHVFQPLIAAESYDMWCGTSCVCKRPHEQQLWAHHFGTANTAAPIILYLFSTFVVQHAPR